MNIDRPTLRLGIAGFAAEQQQQVQAALSAAETAAVEWKLGGFAEADAWWLHGGRTQALPTGILRVAPGQTAARVVQLTLSDVDRPLAVSLPMAGGFQPTFFFRLEDPASMAAILKKFGAWLQPAMAQYALAASIVENEPALAAGAWEVLRGSDLIAVVDVRLGTAVAPQATPLDFADATWCIRDHGEANLPREFIQASLSQLMWQYAARTTRDLLPAHYRDKALFFRRPPRLAQRKMDDAHLLLLRDLAGHPGSRFEEVGQRTGLGESTLARHLAALYLVGSITANPNRAATWHSRPAGDASDSALPSVTPSGLDAASGPGGLTPQQALDLTVPAPLSPE
ncbi:hypothetical protein FN976_20770 [Caenimonas sedimenti]|uniref:Uncharacterized protein n=1 Tax=Caenimonas sedimenti TaxID=2596921 RepID=A0A562ZKH4_9BURK|nr:hypothetical protein [Caenimonas sedimenti]TWO68836.1 hypothetical protein FN976_20770 [Caenimonas sedimenti]